MKAWWLGLQASERRTLAIGGAVLLVMAVYFGVWVPLQNDITRLEKQVKEQQAVKRWMEQASQQALRLKGSSAGNSQVARSGRSLLSLVDQAAKRGRLSDNLKRLEPDGSSAVKVWLEQASFDDMMKWLVSLEKKHGLKITTITIDRQADSGRVNARMTLQGPA